MNREERRRAARAGRRDQEAGYADGRWVAPPGQFREVRMVPGTRTGAEHQDFVAGTIFAAGAGVLFPENGPADEPMPPVFAVFLDDGPETFRVCPQLRQLFARLDQVGFAAFHQEVRVAASWAVMASGDPNEEPLAKLKLDFVQPLRASARVLLMAGNYHQAWQYIAGGGLVGLTTMSRIQRVQQRPDATFADGLAACIPVGLATSPGLTQLIRMYDWPADFLHG